MSQFAEIMLAVLVVVALSASFLVGFGHGIKYQQREAEVKNNVSSAAYPESYWDNHIRF
jgi:flagellar basal body-associated protein FliL